METSIVPDPAGSPEYEARRLELHDAVARAVGHLPHNQREVLILSHYEQLAPAEIAAILDIEVTAVKSRLQRARAALREALCEYGPVQSTTDMERPA
jgi:RNA polymerase sigma-70 factor (ECF subfamily)